MPTPRKPTKLKILEGNRGKRKLAPEPEPVPGAPKMPAGMPPDARRLWTFLCEQLDALGLVSIVDGQSLEAACRAVVQARTADADIERLQKRIAAGNDEPRDYYRLSIQNAASKKAWTQWKSFATEFGLTPASRTKLSAGPAAGSNKIDPIEAVLCGD